MRVAVDPLERLLRRLALGNDGVVESVLADDRQGAFPALDPKTGALVRLGALISLGASTTSYRLAVEVAYAAGATDEEIVGCAGRRRPRRPGRREPWRRRRAWPWLSATTSRTT